MADLCRNDRYYNCIGFLLQKSNKSVFIIGKIEINRMKSRLVAICGYTLFWIIFFFVARLIFILVQYHSSFQNNIWELLQSFWHGAKLDFSTTGYYLLLPILFFIPVVYFN